ncbi:MAG TPA: hypothetical protein VMX33_12780 [bacterium]|nr:hypothetical protein [bacterium]
MNLSFLKLRVADCAWILFDAQALAVGGSGSRQPDWSLVAAGVCDRARGAAASGIIVMARSGPSNIIRTWDGQGHECVPAPAALLCASRWLFDAGRAGSDSVAMEYGRDACEALVIDSRTFGLAIGAPEHQDGSPFGAALDGGVIDVAAAGGTGIVIPVRIGSWTLEVTLFDQPPQRSSGRKSSRKVALQTGIEALVVSRQEIRVRRAHHDPILAAAASIASAFIADYADREASVFVGGERLVVQWPERGQVFVAAAPSYCLSGEFWTGEPDLGSPSVH